MGRVVVFYCQVDIAEKGFGVGSLAGFKPIGSNKMLRNH